MLETISNDRLRRDHLPARSDSQITWIEFALTFNGYAEKGDAAACSTFADGARERWESDGTLPSSLSDLRTALFYEQRRWRWGREEPFAAQEWDYWHALVDAIRRHIPD